MKASPHITFLVLLLLLALGCKKENPGIDPVPFIEVNGISPGTAQEYTDSIVISISYRDGDGDLGGNDPNVTNCFITDPRIGSAYGYRIRQLAPDGATIAIQGNLDIIVPGTGITDGSNSQTFSYDVYVTDRAGNNSNTVSTPSITLIR